VIVIVEVTGAFEKGDIVEIRDPLGPELTTGRGSG
jgi:glutamate 5-kinase